MSSISVCVHARAFLTASVRTKLVSKSKKLYTETVHSCFRKLIILLSELRLSSSEQQPVERFSEISRFVSIKPMGLEIDSVPTLFSYLPTSDNRILIAGKVPELTGGTGQLLSYAHRCCCLGSGPAGACDGRRALHRRAAVTGQSAWLGRGVPAATLPAPLRGQTSLFSCS